MAGSFFLQGDTAAGVVPVFLEIQKCYHKLRVCQPPPRVSLPCYLHGLRVCTLTTDESVEVGGALRWKRKKQIHIINISEYKISLFFSFVLYIFIGAKQLNPPTRWSCFRSFFLAALMSFSSHLSALKDNVHNYICPPPSPSLILSFYSDVRWRISTQVRILQVFQVFGGRRLTAHMSVLCVVPKHLRRWRRCATF